MGLRGSGRLIVSLYTNNRMLRNIKNHLFQFLTYLQSLLDPPSQVLGLGFAS